MTALLAVLVVTLLGVVVRQWQLARRLGRDGAHTGPRRDGAEPAGRATSPAHVVTWLRQEIRTPVKAIVGMADLLLDGELAPGQRDQVGRLRDTGAALTRTVDDLLDLCRMDAGHLVLDAQPFNLREAIEMSLDQVAPLAAERRLDLSCQIAIGTPETVDGDAYRLRQIVATLLTTACRRTSAGAVTVSVSARTVERGHELRLLVRDTGAALSAVRTHAVVQPSGATVAPVEAAADAQDFGLAMCRGPCNADGRDPVTPPCGCRDRVRSHRRCRGARARARGEPIASSAASSGYR